MRAVPGTRKAESAEVTGSGNECKWYRTCPLRDFEKRGLLRGRWAERCCKSDWEKCVRYRMEEAGQPHPDWMLPDGSLDDRLMRPCRGGWE